MSCNICLGPDMWLMVMAEADMFAHRVCALLDRNALTNESGITAIGHLHVFPEWSEGFIRKNILRRNSYI